MSRPAAACWTKRVMPTTEACARCAEPKASQIKMPSQRAASCLEKAPSFFSSSAWKRTFSRTSTSPSRKALLWPSAPGPTQSSAKATGLPRSSSSFFAAGLKEYFSSGPPFGRPRCDASTTRAPFRIALEVGGDEFLFRVAEDAFHRAAGGGFQRGIDGILGGGLVNEDGEVHHADVGRGDAHGVAVELALQLGNDEV